MRSPRTTDTVSLSYGKGRLELKIPQSRCRKADIKAEYSTASPLQTVRRALAEPLGSRPLEDLVQDRKVTFLIEDATRSEPHDAFLEACMPRLKTARRVSAYLTTGSHRRATPGNLRIVEKFKELARENGLRAQVNIHDCHSESSLVEVGTTCRGTPVVVNHTALACDVFLVTSEMKNHYFAGYCSALKDFLPGICAYRTIEANHALALDPQSTFGQHPWHPEANRRANPLAEDIVEGFEMISDGRPVFTVASISMGDRALWTTAGDIRQVVPAGIEMVDELEGAPMPRCRRAIVSPGGDPEDESLYNAQRALEQARNCLADGAEVLFLAACSQGVAPTQKAKENFFDVLTRPLGKALASVEDRYVLYAHKPYKFATLLKRLSAVHMVTELDRAIVESAHMQKTENPQRIVDRWLEESDEPILVVDHANKIALYPAEA